VKQWCGLWSEPGEANSAPSPLVCTTLPHYSLLTDQISPTIIENYLIRKEHGNQLVSEIHSDLDSWI